MSSLRGNYPLSQVEVRDDDCYRAVDASDAADRLRLRVMATSFC